MSEHGGACGCLPCAIGKTIRGYYTARGSICPQTGVVVLDCFAILESLAVISDEIFRQMPLEENQMQLKSFFHECVDVAYKVRQQAKTLKELPVEGVKPN